MEELNAHATRIRPVFGVCLVWLERYGQGVVSEDIADGGKEVVG